MKNKNKLNFQTFDEFMKEHLSKNPEELMLYLDVALEEYENDGNTRALMIAIRRVAEVKGGITELAKKTNLSSSTQHQKEH